MTENEIKLLEIAKEIISLNRDLDARLTGSLMLAIMGINKRREASDIDIIYTYLCEKDDGFPCVPKGFKLVSMDGNRSEVDAVQFKNESGLKIEFMYSEEAVEEINGIKCGELKYLIEAKQLYAKNDLNDESRQKHIDDLEYLYKNNDIESFFNQKTNNCYIFILPQK